MPCVYLHRHLLSMNTHSLLVYRLEQFFVSFFRVHEFNTCIHTHDIVLHVYFVLVGS